MTDILKASAGSGKTYNLAKKYITLLLGSGDSCEYRHILAVTFTNKATSEMKSRILKELQVLAENPDSSSYLADLIKDTGLDKDTICRESKRFLTDILHDYSMFSVSTVDKFFQQTLKAFTREIGCFDTYQVELDRESLVRESIDRLLDSITEDSVDILKWIDESMRDDLSRGARFRVDSNLLVTAEKLASGKFDAAVKVTGIDPSEAFSKESLSAIRKECNEIVSGFENRVADAANLTLSMISDKALPYLQSFIQGLTPGSRIVCPSQKTLMDAVPGTPFGLVMGHPYDLYNTAWQIRDLTYALGFIRDFRQQMDMLLKEKNVLSLDDSNAILKRIIDGSDAPFVYEKMGVRYHNFLLDEFQDTSRVQWENILPLLKEGASNGGANFIVGDVKQSIYRWRNSDWKLLSEEVQRDLDDCSAPVSLADNYRSLETIVNFNNGFFSYILKKIPPTTCSTLSEVYSDVHQNVKLADPQAGSVEVTFTADQQTAILDSVKNAFAAGALPGDIAVLVKTHKQGKKVADILIGEGYDVVSDDSLDVKSSLIVGKVIARLSLFENESDKIAAYIAGGAPDVEHIANPTLMDEVESYLRDLKRDYPEDYEAETVYIYSFVDALQDWLSVNGNKASEFVEYWKETDFVASSPEDSAAIRIMTIHKSKGLEFPYVIIPYAEDFKFAARFSWNWCTPRKSPEISFSTLDKAIYPVPFSETVSPHSYFDEYFKAERSLELIDAVNLFYVALTRAGKGLHIISDVPSKNCCTAYKKNVEYDFKSLSELLYWYQNGCASFRYGQMYDFSSMERKLSSDIPLKADYFSEPIGQRLKPSTDAYDYFGDDGAVGVDGSSRLAGLALHEILSSVNVLSDLDSYQGRTEYDMLRERVASHPDWFPEVGTACVFNETTIISGDGMLLRPDRVIIRGNDVVIIDYKFAEPRLKYERQVRDYANLYRQMGYEDVKAYLWYVFEDNVVEVNPPIGL